tara:strand:+ start:9455 stop:9601 length:147 start_codon:yes stop_codon:yes gene_type:complete
MNKKAGVMGIVTKFIFVIFLIALFAYIFVRYMGISSNSLATYKTIAGK